MVYFERSEFWHRTGKITQSAGRWLATVGLLNVLKDFEASKPDRPVYHAVVPVDHGLFLGESRRMHPSVCRFVSETAYEGRLVSHPDCAKQEVEIPENASLITKGNGVVFIGIEHDGNIQQSDEEIAQVKAVYEELLGRTYRRFGRFGLRQLTAGLGANLWEL